MSARDEESALKKPLIVGKVVEDGSLDFHGAPALASKTGGSLAAAPILVFAVLTAMSLYGVSYNLVLYMVNVLGLSSAAAATHVSMWTFAHDLSPLLTAYVADAHLGRFTTTLASSVIFTAGMALLAASALFIQGHLGTSWPFFVALYMVALGKGFASPLLAFGGDQFDGNDEDEAGGMSSFFSWYYFSGSVGLLLAVVGVVYVADKLGFSGAATLCAGAMIVGLVAFCSGVKVYRYKPPSKHQSIFRWEAYSEISNGAGYTGICSIWLGSIVYEAMRSQTVSLFVEQGALMDTSLWKHHIPPASLNCFDPISVLVWTVIYDKILRPCVGRFSGKPKGFTFFQRMGTGLVVMTAAMVCAALVEAKRLEAVHSGSEQLSVLWQIPQFALVGASKVFYYVGLIEFLYDQVPEKMKTLGAALSMLAASVGSFVSGLLVSITSSITGSGEGGWIPRDLDQGHLDYFFWLLVGLGVINCLYFLWCSYTYKRALN